MAFERVFGFLPDNPSYYHIAFTHRSNPVPDPTGITGGHNERLEFLGDSVISTVVSDFLFHKFPEIDEGQLTQMRSKLVKRDNLNRWAKVFNFPEFLQHDKGLTTNQQFKDTVYGNAFEAFIGAMYLDKGYDFTSQFLNSKILSSLVDLKQLKKADANFKSRLIEWSQQCKREVRFDISSYEDTGKISVFKAIVYIEEAKMGEGEAKRKKEAEQIAAKQALEALGELE